MSEQVITRFAPSPTGYLHIGHAYSAIFAYNFAKSHGGQFILRIEDIDHIRCRPEYRDAIFEDLAWLGLTWEEPVRIQSQHYPAYKKALKALDATGVVYPCFCSRREIRAEVAAAGHAAHCPEGPVYPGMCRDLAKKTQTARMHSGEEYALRLNLDAALKIIDPARLFWLEGTEEQKILTKPETLGDIVLARKDIGTSYHLSVVIDDALQNITHVTRGTELQYATNIHRVLQELMGYQAPKYIHHQLITDSNGEKFSKRDHSVDLRQMRESGIKPADIFEMIEMRPLN